MNSFYVGLAGIGVMIAYLVIVALVEEMRDRK